MSYQVIRDGSQLVVQSTKRNAFISWDLERTPASRERWWWRPAGVWCECHGEYVYAFGDLLDGRVGPKYMQTLAKAMRKLIHAEAKEGGE